MFTGLIEEVGIVEASRPQDRGARIVVRSERLWEGLEIGDSVSVNGVCLTVVEKRRGGFEADVSAESLERTTLGHLKRGAKVNLERALTLSSPLGGHLVLGHVDGVGRITGMDTEGEGSVFEFAYPPELDIYLVDKGSIAVDGISLTVNQCDAGSFGVSIIPHTGLVSTIGFKKVGERVNIETDMIGKYVERFLKGDKAEQREAKGGSVSMELLAKNGFLD